MANKYFRNAGPYWHTSANWSLTSGGAGGAGIPTKDDNVFFDTNSTNCTILVDAVCNNFSITANKTITIGHTLTPTLNYNLNIMGSFYMNAGSIIPNTYPNTVYVFSTFILEGTGSITETLLVRVFNNVTLDNSTNPQGFLSIIPKNNDIAVNAISAVNSSSLTIGSADSMTYSSTATYNMVNGIPTLYIQPILDIAQYPTVGHPINFNGTYFTIISFNSVANTIQLLETPPIGTLINTLYGYAYYTSMSNPNYNVYLEHDLIGTTTELRVEVGTTFNVGYSINVLTLRLADTCQLTSNSFHTIGTLMVDIPSGLLVSSGYPTIKITTTIVVYNMYNRIQCPFTNWLFSGYDVTLGSVSSYDIKTNFLYNVRVEGVLKMDYGALVVSNVLTMSNAARIICAHDNTTFSITIGYLKLEGTATFGGSSVFYLYNLIHGLNPISFYNCVLTHCETDTRYCAVLPKAPYPTNTLTDCVGFDRAGDTAKRFFVGGGINDNWSNTANWSLTDGGAGGATVPNAANDVYFSSSTAVNCTIDVNVDCNCFIITSYSIQLIADNITIHAHNYMDVRRLSLYFTNVNIIVDGDILFDETVITDPSTVVWNCIGGHIFAYYAYDSSRKDNFKLMTINMTPLDGNYTVYTKGEINSGYLISGVLPNLTVNIAGSTQHSVRLLDNCLLDTLSINGIFNANGNLIRATQVSVLTNDSANLLLQSNINADWYAVITPISIHYISNLTASAGTVTVIGSPNITIGASILFNGTGKCVSSSETWVLSTTSLTFSGQQLYNVQLTSGVAFTGQLSVLNTLTISPNVQIVVSGSNSDLITHFLVCNGTLANPISISSTDTWYFVVRNPTSVTYTSAHNCFSQFGDFLPDASNSTIIRYWGTVIDATSDTNTDALNNNYWDFGEGIEVPVVGGTVVSTGTTQLSENLAISATTARLQDAMYIPLTQGNGYKANSGFAVSELDLNTIQEIQTKAVNANFVSIIKYPGFIRRVI